MIKTVLLDLDNTLLDFDAAEKAALRKTLIQMGIEPKESTLARYSVINLAQWKLLEKGILTRSQVKRRRFTLLFEELGAKEANPEEAIEIYEGHLGQGHYFIEGAEKLLQDLQGFYDLYVVTNGTASVQKGRIESAGIRRYVKDIFISESIGHNKPSPEYFQYCFEHIPGFQRNAAVIVGDSLSSDIQGGYNAGITTVWFHPASDNKKEVVTVTPDYQISKLSELPDLLLTI